MKRVSYNLDSSSSFNKQAFVKKKIKEALDTLKKSILKKVNFSYLTKLFLERLNHIWGSRLKDASNYRIKKCEEVGVFGYKSGNFIFTFKKNLGVKNRVIARKEKSGSISPFISKIINELWHRDSEVEDSIQADGMNALLGVRNYFLDNTTLSLLDSGVDGLYECSHEGIDTLKKAFWSRIESISSTLVKILKAFLFIGVGYLIVKLLFGAFAYFWSLNAVTKFNVLALPFVLVFGPEYLGGGRRASKKSLDEDLSHFYISLRTVMV